MIYTLIKMKTDEREKHPEIDCGCSVFVDKITNVLIAIEYSHNERTCTASLRDVILSKMDCYDLWEIAHDYNGNFETIINKLPKKYQKFEMKV